MAENRGSCTNTTGDTVCKRRTYNIIIFFKLTGVHNNGYIYTADTAADETYRVYALIIIIINLTNLHKVVCKLTQTSGLQ